MGRVLFNVCKVTFFLRMEQTFAVILLLISIIRGNFEHKKRRMVSKMLTNLLIRKKDKFIHTIIS